MKSEIVDVEDLKTTTAPTQELVDSIKELGVINPIRVQRIDMKIVDGQRRVAACKILGILAVRAVFVEVTDEQLAEATLAVSSGYGKATVEEYKANLVRLCRCKPDMTLKDLAVILAVPGAR